MLGMLLLMLGNGLQGTLLGVRGSLENIDPAMMGYIMSGYFIGFLGGSKATPWMLRRVGHIRVFAALGSLVSAAFILYAAVVHPAAWLLLRLIVGFCFSGIYVVAESWLNDSTPNETRGQALSLYLIVQMLGIVLGQLLLNVADPGGYNLFVLITVLVSISFAPILLSVSKAPVHDTAKAMSIRELIEASPLACFGTLLLGGVFRNLIRNGTGLRDAERLYHCRSIVFYYRHLFGRYVTAVSHWLVIRSIRPALSYYYRYRLGRVSRCGRIVVQPELYRATRAIAFGIGGTSTPLYSLLLAYANDYT